MGSAQYNNRIMGWSSPIQNLMVGYVEPNKKWARPDVARNPAHHVDMAALTWNMSMTPRFVTACS